MILGPASGPLRVCESHRQADKASFLDPSRDVLHERSGAIEFA